MRSARKCYDLPCAPVTWVSLFASDATTQGSFNVQPYTYEWLCQQIVANTQDAIIAADRDGIICLWNAAAETMFGYQANEVLGQTLDLIIPESLRERHWTGYRRTMATGTSRYGRELLAVPAIRKDGTRISLEFSIVMLRDSSGETLGSAAIIRDVTARWQRDKAMRERLTALEARLQHASNRGQPYNEDELLKAD
jgi:PAS domain S-box-containing protein